MQSVLPEDAPENWFQDTRWRFPCHFSIGIVGSATLTYEKDPTNDHQLRFTDHDLETLRPEIARLDDPGIGWNGYDCSVEDLVTGISSAWERYTLPWLADWTAPAFLAAYNARDSNSWNLITPLETALLYHLDGDAARTLNWFQECSRRSRIPIRELERRRRQPGFLGFGPGRSSLESRSFARNRYRLGRKQEAVLHQIAERLGYGLEASKEGGG